MNPAADIRRAAAYAALLLLPLFPVRLPAAENVIVFFVNGVNQAGLELARTAGDGFAGLSNTAALPVSGTLLPLSREFDRPQLAAANAVAAGKAADDSIGTLSSGEDLDSLATLAKLRSRKVGIVTDSLLTAPLPGAFYAHEARIGEPGVLSDWLPLCDFNVLAGEVLLPPGESGGGDRLGDTMARIGYRNVLDVKNLTASVSRLFLRHSDSPGRRYAATRKSREERERLIGSVSAALRSLDNPAGLFLVVECGNIAAAGTENDSSMLLGELWMFDRALGEALRFFKEDPAKTLIVVISLYDAGELQLTGGADTDFPVGPGRIELTPFTARNYKNHHAWRMEITVRGDEKLYGILCVPKTPGRYPALITIPGAGPGTAAPWIDDADGELIILLVNVHRYEPSVDRKLLAEQYRECNAAAGMPYMFEHAEDRERYFYRRVFLGLAQAADHVAGMKEFDGKNLGVTGSSQGAAAALALAAINHRITAVAVNVPAMCDHDGWRVGRKSGWPEWHRNRPDGDAVAPYYDGCNFARLIEAPVFMAVGFNDLTAPAAGGYAAWNLLRGEKTMLPMFDRGHEIPDFCGRKMRDFLRSHGIGR
ncbi:hypothetical protein SDC9_82846 [bioreactor metagenome]|uniref:Acetyl xylan esterase domain-containing protein n=1 Tax=bioreactor metagenome TaxID=1076179 RepID=A0A644Z8C9_9ZZZZ